MVEIVQGLRSAPICFQTFISRLADMISPKSHGQYDDKWSFSHTQTAKKQDAEVEQKRIHQGQQDFVQERLQAVGVERELCHAHCPAQTPTLVLTHVPDLWFRPTSNGGTRVRLDVDQNSQSLLVLGVAVRGVRVDEDDAFLQFGVGWRP